MNTENDILMTAIVKKIVNDFLEKGIKSFGDWFKIYGEEPYDEVLKIVNDYVTKVNENRVNEIEHWENVVMLNSVALFMIEMDINDLPHEKLRNKIFKAFVTSIRNYKALKAKTLLLNQEIFIYKLIEEQFAKA